MARLRSRRLERGLAGVRRQCRQGRVGKERREHVCAPPRRPHAGNSRPQRRGQETLRKAASGKDKDVEMFYVWWRPWRFRRAAGIGAASSRRRSRNSTRARPDTIMLGQPPGGSYDLYAPALSPTTWPSTFPAIPPSSSSTQTAGRRRRCAKLSSSTRKVAAQRTVPRSLLGNHRPHAAACSPKIGKWNVRRNVICRLVRAGERRLRRPQRQRPRKLRGDAAEADDVGCTGRSSQSYQSPALLKNLGGFKFKPVCGYPVEGLRAGFGSRRGRHGVECLESSGGPAIGRRSPTAA